MQTELTSQPPSVTADPVKELLEAGRRHEFEREVEVLRHGRWRERRWAAGFVVEFGPQALDPLCEALADRDDRVKAAAAKALAELGDSRAVHPILKALNQSLAGGSGRRHALLRAAPTFVSLVSICMWLPLHFTGRFQAGFLVVVTSWLLRLTLNVAVASWDHARFQRAAIEALADLAECDPVPELRAALPDLRALARTGFQDWDARHAAGDAAERIDRLTAECRSLPIAAEAPELDAATLPGPASGNGQEPGVLPLPTKH